MKNLLLKYKNTISAYLWFIAGILFFVLISASNQQLNNSICTGLIIKIDTNEGNRFVDEKDVMDLLFSQIPGGNLNVALKFIDTKAIELFLEDQYYIKNAEVFIDMNNKMHIEIEQHYPILRVINNQNTNYYITQKGAKMPATAQFSARVPIVTGYVQDTNTNLGQLTTKMENNLFNLAQLIDENQFWKSIIEQIYVGKDGNVILIPKIGDHEIELGDLNNLKQKLNTLYLFYTEGLSNAGWNTYKKISVKYNNQIVATKR